MKTQKGLAYQNSQKKALMILKRRKIYESQLNSLMNQQFNIDQVQFTSESIQNTVDTVIYQYHQQAATLKIAVDAQKTQMAQINVDQMEDLQEDMTDMMADQEEVQEVLGRDYAVGAFDEGELAQELDELDEDIVNEKIEGAVSIPSYIPQGAKAQPSVKKDAEDLEQIMNN